MRRIGQVLIGLLALCATRPLMAQLSVQVGPDNGTHPDPKIRLANSAGNTVTFTVTNNGTIDAQFTRTCTGIGNVTTVTCTTLGLIAAGDAKTVTATFSVAGAGTGSVQMSVTSTNPTGAAGVGKWDETIVAGGAGVTPDGGVATQAPNLGSLSQVFTIANTARAAGTYALAAVCSGAGLVPGCTIPGSITLDSAGVAAGTGTATVTYATNGPGLTGTITVTASYGGTTLDVGTVTVRVPSAAVTPKGQAVNVLPNAPQTQVFSISNSGPVAVTYTLTPACSLTGVAAGCSVSPTTVTPNNNGVPVTATVSYSSLGVGLPGLVVLRATYAGAILDTGYVNVTVVNPPPVADVFPQGATDGLQVTVPPGISTNQQVFSIRNPGGSNTTYTLTPGCSGTGVALTCSVGTPTLLVNAGQTGSATVTYTSLNAGAAGQVVLRAAVSGALLDTGYVNVAVAGASVVPTGQTDGVNVNQGAGVTASQSFTIMNTGTTTTTYALTSGCTVGGVTNCILTPTTTPAVAAGASTTASIQYQTTTVGNSSKVIVRALLSGVVLDTGWVMVNVTAVPGTPTVTTAAVNPGATVPRDQCVTIALGAAAASECGDLRLVQAVPAVRTLNVARAPTLLYNSGYAEPTPSASAVVRISSQVTRPDSVIGTLRRAGVQVGRGAWPGTQWTVGGTSRIIRVRDTTAAPATGLVAYTLDVTNKYNGGSSFTTTVAADLAVINRKTSPYGQGWWVAGLEQVVPIAGSNDFLWIGGDGSTRRFTKITTTLWRGPTPAVSFLDSLTLASNGPVREFTRRLPGGLKVVFDSATGRHLRTINRLGYVTQFGYDGSGRLQTITLPIPVGGTTETFAFAYPAGQMTITDGAAPPRTTTVTFTGGRVTSIADPANNPVTFGYGGQPGW